MLPGPISCSYWYVGMSDVLLEFQCRTRSESILISYLQRRLSYLSRVVRTRKPEDKRVRKIVNSDSWILSQHYKCFEGA